MVTAITNGKDFNFFQRVSVSFSSASAYQTDADIVFNFRGEQSFTLMNEGSSVIEYSYNGTTTHGDMDSTKDSKTLRFDNRRVSRIWFRVKSGSTSSVRVEAWAKV